MGKKKRERKGKSIVWFGPESKKKFEGVKFEGVSYTPPNYGKGPIHHGRGKGEFNPFVSSKGPYPDLFSKSKKQRKKKK